MEDKLPILLTVYDVKTGEEIQRKTLDFKNREDRQNIAKTAWWAMHSGHELRTRPIPDQAGTSS